MKTALGERCGAGVGGRGCGDGFWVGRSLEQCLRARFGHLPGAGLDEGQRPALPGLDSQMPSWIWLVPS